MKAITGRKIYVNPVYVCINEKITSIYRMIVMKRKKWYLCITVFFVSVCLIGCSGSDKTEAQNQKISGTNAEAKKTLSAVDSVLVPKRLVPQREAPNILESLSELGDYPTEEKYWPDGQLKQKTTNLGGDTTYSHIVFETWYENGQKHSVEEYVEKKQHGRMIKWYPDGKPQFDGYFENGEPHDTNLVYWNNGNLRHLKVYNHGVQVGLWEQYYESGPIEKRGNFVNGVIDGDYSAFYLNGQVKFRGQYRNGNMDGLWLKYFESGKLKARSNYKNGQKHGLYEVFDESGDPIIKEKYVNGEMVESSRNKAIVGDSVINPRIR